MIISHKHKFIFIKPKKVAGTSIEIALAKHCGENDIITPIAYFDSDYDSTEYIHPAKNYKKGKYYNHIKPKDIKKKIGKEIWNEYFKFTIARNPYDQMVSAYFWNNRFKPSTKKQKTINFKSIYKNILNIKAYIFIVKKIKYKLIKIIFLPFKLGKFGMFIICNKKSSPNKRYYFNKSGKPVCDFYIKYENLEKDYQKACKKIGIPYAQLPKTKNRIKKTTKQYSHYYNKKTKFLLKIIAKKELSYFNYTFKN